MTIKIDPRTGMYVVPEMMDQAVPQPHNFRPSPQPQGQDTVRADLTPGEAVIPAPVAQDPQFQPMIKAMVEEGRARNTTRQGTTDVPAFENGEEEVPAYTLDQFKNWTKDIHAENAKRYGHDPETKIPVSAYVGSTYSPKDIHDDDAVKFGGRHHSGIGDPWISYSLTNSRGEDTVRHELAHRYRGTFEGDHSDHGHDAEWYRIARELKVSDENLATNNELYGTNYNNGIPSVPPVQHYNPGTEGASNSFFDYLSPYSLATKAGDALEERGLTPSQLAGQALEALGSGEVTDSPLTPNYPGDVPFVPRIIETGAGDYFTGRTRASVDQYQEDFDDNLYRINKIDEKLKTLSLDSTEYKELTKERGKLVDITKSIPGAIARTEGRAAAGEIENIELKQAQKAYDLEQAKKVLGPDEVARIEAVEGTGKSAEEEQAEREAAIVAEENKQAQINKYKVPLSAVKNSTDAMAIIQDPAAPDEIKAEAYELFNSYLGPEAQARLEAYEASPEGVVDRAVQDRAEKIKEAIENPDIPDEAIIGDEDFDPRSRLVNNQRIASGPDEPKTKGWFKRLGDAFVNGIATNFSPENLVAGLIEYYGTLAITGDYQMAARNALGGHGKRVQTEQNIKARREEQDRTRKVSKRDRSIASLIQQARANPHHYDNTNGQLDQALSLLESGELEQGQLILDSARTGLERYDTNTVQLDIPNGKGSFTKRTARLSDDRTHYTYEDENGVFHRVDASDALAHKPERDIRAVTEKVETDFRRDATNQYSKEYKGLVRDFLKDGDIHGLQQFLSEHQAAQPAIYKFTKADPKYLDIKMPNGQTVRGVARTAEDPNNPGSFLRVITMPNGAQTTDLRLHTNGATVGPAKDAATRAREVSERRDTLSGRMAETFQGQLAQLGTENASAIAKGLSQTEVGKVLEVSKLFYDFQLDNPEDYEAVTNAAIVTSKEVAKYTARNLKEGRDDIPSTEGLFAKNFYLGKGGIDEGAFNVNGDRDANLISTATIMDIDTLLNTTASKELAGNSSKTDITRRKAEILSTISRALPTLRNNRDFIREAKLGSAKGDPNDNELSLAIKYLLKNRKLDKKERALLGV